MLNERFTSQIDSESDRDCCTTLYTGTLKWWPFQCSIPIWYNCRSRLRRASEDLKKATWILTTSANSPRKFKIHGCLCSNACSLNCWFKRLNCQFKLLNRQVQVLNRLFKTQGPCNWWLFSSFRPKMVFGQCQEEQSLQELAGSLQEWSSAWISIKTSSWCYDINCQVPIRSNLQGKSTSQVFSFWGIVFWSADNCSFCLVYQAQQSLSCHFAQFLCPPSYVTTPDKTLFPLLTFNKERVVCKFYVNLYLKVDVEVVKELYSISLHLTWILSPVELQPSDFFSA
jgi:hypothetical protein